MTLRPSREAARLQSTSEVTGDAQEPLVRSSYVAPDDASTCVRVWQRRRMPAGVSVYQRGCAETRTWATRTRAEQGGQRGGVGRQRSRGQGMFIKVER